MNEATEVIRLLVSHLNKWIYNWWFNIIYLKNILNNLLQIFFFWWFSIYYSNLGKNENIKEPSFIQYQLLKTITQK